MDESVTSLASRPVSANTPPPLISYSLKQEVDYDTPELEEEINPLEQEDELITIDQEDDCNSLEPEKDFILTFETLPVLWDTKNPHYTNKYRRNKALAKLVPILKKTKPVATIQDVKKKINSIRSNYRRELRKIIASQQPGAKESDVYRPKIWYFPYLNFLRKLEQRQSSAQQNEDDPDEENSQRLHEISQVGTSFSSVIIPETTSSRVKKRTSRGQLLDVPSPSLPKLCNESCQPKKISNHIVLEWADILEKLDPLQRLYAKKAINDVLFEAELGNLHKNSIKINESIPNFTLSSPQSSSVKSPPSPTSP
ncbi:uncharacterized protein LOC125065293 [Vanessa atalanta]|uniref:uncharacterized protein LOC125065293 n=1 Tax=Vanessa atalanta TaxID=42275 RepID=UPI001FCCF626|nr:uncharacterized protein LOC125065293 [Vanessa atalanta]